MPYTKEQLDKMFSDLPDDVREAMTSVDTMEVLNEIKEKYKLHIDQVGQLSAEIALLMVGVISSSRFVPNLENLMMIPKETAKTIASEVNEKIFQRVRNTLKSMKHDESNDTWEEKPEESKKENSDSDVPQKPHVADPYREPIQ
ncbi:MAG: hypothetical protein WC878_00460 [Candidatus Paceibacterota bacterium]|jgi:hypothetical protein